MRDKGWVSALPRRCGMFGIHALLAAATLAPAAAAAQEPRPTPPAQAAGLPADTRALQRELAEARALLTEQSRKLAEQERRLDLLEQRLAGVAQATQAARDQALASGTPAPAPVGSTPVQVGQAPSDIDRAPPVAVLDQQGRVVTRQGQLAVEFGVDYARSDRNRAIFRGVELIESILVGVFDINESRQDILTASGSLRYGLTDRLEIGGRVPVIYRSDKLVVAPVAGSTNNDPARTIDSSVSGASVGDIELTARYQLNDGGRNMPFLIANLQTVLPTGRDPFAVRRDENGSAEEVATGAGFWGVSPSLTAILPSEPAVLFGTLGYTFNFSKDVDTRIPPVQILWVNPGDAINASAGMGLALNDRTSFNLGYAHSWVFGTTTVTRALSQTTGEPVGDPMRTTSRDLQIGRLLFGVTQRLSGRSSFNWSVEVGATQDAPDVRTSIRVPITL